MKIDADLNLVLKNNPLIGSSDTPSMLGTNTDASNGKNNSLENAQIRTTENANRLADSFSSLTDVAKKMKQFYEAQQNIPPLLPKINSNDFLNDDNTETKLKNRNPSLRRVPGVNGVVSASDNFANVVVSASNGNLTGVLNNGLSGLNNGMQNVQNFAGSMGAGTGVLAGLGIGMGAVKVAGAALKGANALAEKYEEALPEIDKMLVNYGGDQALKNNAKQNANLGLKIRSNILDKNVGTGLSAESFLQLTNSMAGYGINSDEKASKLAQVSAQYASFTNSDPNRIANFAGMVERYGGNGETALNQVFGYSQKSGLNKAQFSEFLDGISRVMEDGISKGFIKSWNDIGKELGALSKLSDSNPMWQGTQGANRYMQMMNSAASKTDLNSTTSILMARAAQDVTNKRGIENVLTDSNGKVNAMNFLHDDKGRAINSSLNTLAYVERGNMDMEFMKNFRDRLSNLYGGDVDSQVGALKEAYGLNWSGSIQLYNMMQKIGKDGYTAADFEAEAKKLQNDPNLQSDNKNMMAALSKINDSVVGLGKLPSELKIEGLGKVEDITQNIYDFISKKEFKADVKEISKGLFDSDEGKQEKEFRKKLEADLQSDNAKTRENAQQFVEWYNDLSEPERQQINAENKVNYYYTNQRNRDNADLNKKYINLEDELGLNISYNENYKHYRWDPNEKVGTSREEELAEIYAAAKITKDEKTLNTMNKIIPSALSSYDSKQGWKFDDSELKAIIEHLMTVISDNTAATLKDIKKDIHIYQ